MASVKWNNCSRIGLDLDKKSGPSHKNSVDWRKLVLELSISQYFDALACKVGHKGKDTS